MHIRQSRARTRHVARQFPPAPLRVPAWPYLFLVSRAPWRCSAQRRQRKARPPLLSTHSRRPAPSTRRVAAVGAVHVPMHARYCRGHRWQCHCDNVTRQFPPFRLPRPSVIVDERALCGCGSAWGGKRDPGQRGITPPQLSFRKVESAPHTPLPPPHTRTGHSSVM